VIWIQYKSRLEIEKFNYEITKHEFFFENEY